MLFKTIDGKSKNLFLADYKINWRGKSASKFQFRAKQFFFKYFSHLEWFEEVPLNGELSALRVDFLCRFTDKWGRQKVVMVEADGNFHSRHVGFFNKTEDDFLCMLERDACKHKWCDVNEIPLLRLNPEDEPFELEWFNETFNFPLPVGTV